MTDLDQLLRDTLHGRAATVTDAPPVPSDPPSATRSRWLPVAAAVGAVLVAGGGVAVWGLGSENTGQRSGGGYARTCSTALPPAWVSAFDAARVSIDGHPTYVNAVTSFGEVVTWTAGRDVPHVGLRTAAGRVHTLFVAPAGDDVSASVSGSHLVLSIAPSPTTRVPDPLVDDLVAIDLRSFDVRHLLRSARMPAGTVIADKTAAVLNGTVYWTAVPSGSAAGAQGTVLAYSLASGRTREVGHAPLLASVDPRGVSWTGGNATASHVPASVPRFRSNGFDAVVSDGQNFAWLRADDPQLVGWADSHGDVRQWRVETVSRDGIRSDPIAVSGPFVFLEPLDYADPHVFVLDTRTGAVADSGIQSLGAGGASGSTVALGTRADNHAPFEDVLLDTSRLPELRCR